MPKVFVGVPCGEFTRSRTAACIVAMIMNSPVSIGLKWGFAGDVAENQNIFAQQALDTGSDYLLLVETDMEFPPDSLMRMLEHGRDIVGVIYRFREAPHDPMLWPAGTPVPTSGTLKRPAVPSGLMLINTRILKTLRCPWFYKTYTSTPNYIITSDRNFCDNATAAGFDVIVDCQLSHKILHRGSISISLNLK